MVYTLEEIKNIKIKDDGVKNRIVKVKEGIVDSMKKSYDDFLASIKQNANTVEPENATPVATPVVNEEGEKFEELSIVQLIEAIKDKARITGKRGAIATDIFLSGLRNKGELNVASNNEEKVADNPVTPEVEVPVAETVSEPVVNNVEPVQENISAPIPTVEPELVSVPNEFSETPEVKTVESETKKEETTTTDVNAPVIESVEPTESVDEKVEEQEVTTEKPKVQEASPLTLAEKFDEFKQNLSYITTQNEQYEKANQKLTEKITLQNSTIEDLTKKIMQLKEVIKNLRNEIADLNTQVVQLTTERDNAVKAAQNIESQARTVQQQMTEDHAKALSDITEQYKDEMRALVDALSELMPKDKAMRKAA